MNLARIVEILGSQRIERLPGFWLHRQVAQSPAPPPRTAAPADGAAQPK
ncbi:hypothetical protein [Streptodolium elevatio]|uniref:Uncharacterized protein n=1 Tax=Streptodolium elevatio TaxID=3157996 RepID=A0ABV3DUR9_9ACTN